MKENSINRLRHSARQLIRELGLLNLNDERSNRTTQEWHSLIEIQNEPKITITKLGQILLLSPSRISRLVSVLIKEDLITASDGLDKREKYLQITTKGLNEIKKIDEFTNRKIKGALVFLTEHDQQQIIKAMQKYAEALKENRLMQDQVKIHTLPTARVVRQQIINMIEDIQAHEFSLPVTPELNIAILKAETEFYYNNSYNFWYAVDKNGKVVGSIGLKKIDSVSGEIKKFFVLPLYRGKGISHKLLQVLIKAALKHDFKFLYLGTINKLKAAQSFYEKYGFKKIKAQALPANFEKCHLDNLFLKISCQALQNSIINQISE